MAAEPETSASSYPGNGNYPIPIDLFISKNHPQVTRGDLAFADSEGNIVYRVNRRRCPTSSPDNKKLLLDANSNPLLSIYHDQKGSWKCYKGDSNDDKDLVFKVNRTVKTLTRIELEVFLAGERSEESPCQLKVRGLPFQKSCNIYNDNELVAQTSLMYKLNQIFVGRGKFRLTILFPVSIDHSLLAALVVIFLNGRK
ncbi:hypothetical protein L6164_024013 [Bauhinia variegata]|uniref:Uncharacterized protein n=1 Tax=Bauhinia variegata TaxID=167791 RepID=A0ACB9LWK3_BAUVA|nr:hypothetical protein L6164_024013 [Bauhinia variegata]